MAESFGIWEEKVEGEMVFQMRIEGVGGMRLRRTIRW
jgi:hypothetical protein